MPFDVGIGEVFAARRERRACKRVIKLLHGVDFLGQKRCVVYNRRYDACRLITLGIFLRLGSVYSTSASGAEH